MLHETSMMPYTKTKTMPRIFIDLQVQKDAKLSGVHAAFKNLLNYL